MDYNRLVKEHVQFDLEETRRDHITVVQQSTPEGLHVTLMSSDLCSPMEITYLLPSRYDSVLRAVPDNLHPFSPSVK